MKTLEHFINDKDMIDTQRKVIEFRGRKFNHRIIFNSNIHHSEILKHLLKKHFDLYDFNTKCGFVKE